MGDWVSGVQCRSKKNQSELLSALKRGDKSLGAWKSEQNMTLLNGLIDHLEKTPSEIDLDPKGAIWKVAIAAEMKQRTNASNPWLAENLNMGSPYRLSRLASAFNTTVQSDREAKKMQKACAMCKV